MERGPIGRLVVSMFGLTLFTVFLASKSDAQEFKVATTDGFELPLDTCGSAALLKVGRNECYICPFREVREVGTHVDRKQSSPGSKANLNTRFSS